jgi:hypothetical protein
VSETRDFPTLDVVTVYTGTLVSDQGIDSVYKLCGFMLNDELMTHQLPAASRACEESLAVQHPWLALLDPPRGDVAALKAWCAHLVEQYDDTLPVASIDEPAWKGGNALADLFDIAGDRPVIGITPPEAS